MNVNGKASAVILIAAALAFAGGAASLNSARADTGPNASCSSSAPCLQEDNTGKGSGLKGTSAKGSGVTGTTHAKGTGTTDAGAGVLGQDTQTAASGVSNAGIEGTSTNGFGVLGTTTAGDAVSGQSSSGNGLLGKSSSGNGVSGFSTSRTGVEGVSTQEIGVRGIGATIGVIGDGLTGIEGETTGGTAVLGRTTGAGQQLFRGNNHSNLDVFRVDDAGNVTAAGNIAATGTLSSSKEIDVSGGSIGVHAVGSLVGLLGEATGPGTSILATNLNANAQLFRGHNSAGIDKFIVDNNGNVLAHSFQAVTDQIVIQKNSAGQRVDTYSQQASQPSLEDFGEAQLTNGAASVRLDPAFAAAIDRNAGYLVMVTPEGDCRGLYVAQRTPAGFTIRELQGGRSSIAFTYRIVAKPYGDSSVRLPLATGVPPGFDGAAGPSRGTIRR